MLLGMLEKGCVCDVLSPLLPSDPLFDFKMLCCMKKQLCFYIPFSHLQFGTGTILPDLLCIDLVVSVVSCSPCLMSLYISSMWFQYEVDTSRVSEMALNTASGFFWLSSSFEIGSVFHFLKPSLPRKPTIIANHNYLLMQDAQRAKVTWPFHSSNPCCWSSACQSNIGGWNMSCPVAIVLQID